MQALLSGENIFKANHLRFHGKESRKMSQDLMTAAVVHEFGAPMRIEEVPIPTPAAGQVRIRVIASGVCHTDLHAADGDWPVKPKLPFIPGHEAVAPPTRLEISWVCVLTHRRMRLLSG